MKRKISKQTAHLKRIARATRHDQNLATSKNKLADILDLASLPEKERKLRLLGRQMLKQNAHPEITNKRIGCRYAGWLQISIANRDPEYRLRKMEFYGDWCTSDMLDEILPDMTGEDTQKRTFYVDLNLIDILGNEYEADTFKILNPKNMDDLEQQIKTHVAEIALDEDCCFNLDECYAEIRA